MKTPKTIQKRLNLAKALLETFGYTLADTDKISFSRPYCDKQIVDVTIHTADGKWATVNAYNIRLGCFPW